MPQTSANWAELLEPTLHDNFEEFGAKLPDYVAELFTTLKSRKAAEHSLGRGSIGMMQKWTETGNQVSYDTIAKGWQKDWTHVKYSNGLQIERELWDDDMYDEIRSQVDDLAYSVYYTKQYHGASVFNNAFNSGVTGPDGAALCANSHTLVPGGNVTIDNYDTLALNADNLETARNAMKAWTDDRGNKIPVNPDLLLVPPGLRKTARVISESDGEPDVSDNNVNVWKGQLKVIEWEMLTDSNAWFLIDSRRMKQYLIWWNRRIPKLEQDGDNFDTEVAKWKVVGRWSYGWKSPLWIYGCNPS